MECAKKCALPGLTETTMANVSIYLDTRRMKSDGTCLLKMAVRAKKLARYISLDIYLSPDQWDDETKSVKENHPMQTKLNLAISRKLHLAESVMINYAVQDKDPSVDEAADAVREILGKPKIEKVEKPVTNTFGARFERFADSRPKPKTQEVYRHTMNRLDLLMNGWRELTFDEINIDWLKKFDNELEKTGAAVNTRNIHFRNIRAVFNEAMDDEITKNYPFRKFKLKTVETEKRSLTVEQLRMLWNYPCEEYQRPYLDMFKLMFMLCGINMIDLFNLKGLVNGRVVYDRAKTGRHYSIKVEPEAMAIIERYKGTDWLLNIHDRYKSHTNYGKDMNDALQSIGEWHRLPGRGGKKELHPLFPGLSTYWSRHTWATIAAEIDVPDAVISQALGHRPENRVTDIYIRRNPKKVDDANRRVLDYVLYGKE